MDRGWIAGEFIRAALGVSAVTVAGPSVFAVRVDRLTGISGVCAQLRHDVLASLRFRSYEIFAICEWQCSPCSWPPSSPMPRYRSAPIGLSTGRTGVASLVRLEGGSIVGGTLTGLDRTGVVSPMPSRITVHRILIHHGMIDPKARRQNPGTTIRRRPGRTSRAHCRELVERIMRVLGRTHG